METSPPRSASPRSTASALSATARIPCASTSSSTPCPPVPLYWPLFSLRPSAVKRTPFRSRSAHVGLLQIFRRRLHYIVVIAVQHILHRRLSIHSLSDAIEDSFHIAHPVGLDNV